MTTNSPKGPNEVMNQLPFPHQNNIDAAYIVFLDILEAFITNIRNLIFHSSSPGQQYSYSVRHWKGEDESSTNILS